MSRFRTKRPRRVERPEVPVDERVYAALEHLLRPARGEHHAHPGERFGAETVRESNQDGHAREVVVGARDHLAPGDVGAECRRADRGDGAGREQAAVARRRAQGHQGGRRDDRPPQRQRGVEALDQAWEPPRDGALEGLVEDAPSWRGVVVRQHHERQIGAGVANLGHDVGGCPRTRDQPPPGTQAVGGVVGDRCGRKRGHEAAGTRARPASANAPAAAPAAPSGSSWAA